MPAERDLCVPMGGSFDRLPKYDIRESDIIHCKAQLHFGDFDPSSKKASVPSR
jgi:hypothetical protein